MIRMLRRGARKRSMGRWSRASAGGLAVGGLLAAGLGLQSAGGSSHREAPMITEDPVADNTDVYAFVSPDDPDSVTLVANWIPNEDPASGPNFHRFGDDVLYKIKLDLNGDAHEDLTYHWRFSTKIMNPNTFLYNTGQVTSLEDADLNMVQTYSVTEFSGEDHRTIAENLVVPPANIGPRSTPDYEENLGSAGVYTVPGDYGDVELFAGPRKDPFFVDLGSAFDLLGLRPLNPAHLIPLGGADGVDTLEKSNVHTIAIKLPIALIEEKKAELAEHGDHHDEDEDNDGKDKGKGKGKGDNGKSGKSGGDDDMEDGDGNPVTDDVIGVWSTTLRQSNRVLNHDSSTESWGDWVQISRLGMPLVNEVVIPLKDKDRFNATYPVADGQFANYVLDPELGKLIPVLYPGVTVPAAPRNDLATIFLTGIPGLNQPANVVASEMLRLNYSIKPTKADPNAQNRLGLLAGEMDGFPNGRRLVDDVTDIALRAAAGGTPFTPDFNKFPNNALTDGVDASNEQFLGHFPYVAPPLQGYDR